MRIKFQFLFFILSCLAMFEARAQLVPDFKANVTSGCSPLIVNFTDLSTGNIKSWYWDFGNGNSSVLQNPGTFYINPGAYSVKLLVIDNSGQRDSILKPYYISSFSAPKAGLSANITSGCTPLTVKFKDLSIPQSVPIVSWYWNFGDGNSSTEQHPTHTFNNNGKFTITLNVIDANGCQSFYYINKYITAESPKAEFDYSLSNCSAPSTITLANKSQGSNLSYKWYFGDGNTSTSHSPSHLYTTSGQYIISLVCTDQQGCKDSISKTIGFNKPDFDYTVSCTSPGSYTMNFTDLTTPAPLSWEWIFGDGTKSYSQNPVHVYDTVKSYTISMIVNTTLGCIDTVKKKYDVPKAKLVSNVLLCPSPFQVSFTNLSSGTGNFTYNWNFGNGTKSTLVNPTHVYNETYKIYNYVYTITLVATNHFGCADSVKVPLSVSKPQAVFASNVQSGCVPLSVNFGDISTSSETISSYKWDFGDPSSGALNTSSLKNPSHVFNNIGKYKVTLMIQTVNGCADTMVNYIKSGVSPDKLDFKIYPSDTVCFHSLVSFTDESEYNDTTIKSDYWCWTTKFDPANPVWMSDAFNWISCSDSGFSDPHNILSTLKNTSHIFDKYHFSIKPVVKAGDTTYVSNYQSIFGRDTVALITGYNGCNDTIFKEIFINGPAALSGFVLQDDTALAYCEAPVNIGFFNASLNYDTMNSFEIINKKTGITEKVFTDPKDTVFVNFNKSGIYTIQISVANNSTSCSDVGIRELTIDSVYQQFSITPKTSCSNNNKIKFKDLSTSTYGKIRSWYWNFGDGHSLFSGDTLLSKNPFTGDTSLYFMHSGVANDSIIKVDSNNGLTTGTYGSPSHNYKSPGKYIVKSVIITEVPYLLKNDWRYEYKQCTYTKYDTIQIVGTVANFSMLKNNVCTYDTVKFIDNSTSTGKILSWQWDFGDNSTNSSLKNPTHIYSKAGTYTVKLITTDDVGCIDSIIKKNVLTVSSPVSVFTASDDKICAGDSVQLTNLSTGNASSYVWIFGDNTPNSGIKNVKHAYQLNGKITTYLVAIDNNGCKDSSSIDITVSGKPRIGFKADTLKSSCPPLFVQFTDTALLQNAVKWKWDFGDGNFSSQSFPAHLYTYPGNFDVKLWVENSIGCSDSLTVYGMIKIGGPYGQYSFTPDSFCVPSPVVFNYQIQNADYMFMDFGDGEVKLYNAPNIPLSETHDYTRGGILTPQIILKDNTGCTVTLPSAGLVFSDDLKAQFSTTSKIFCEMKSISFTNTSISQFSSSYSWTFGDGNSSNVFSPSHNYALPGKYPVKLDAVSVLGCTSSFTENISLHQKPNLSIFMKDTNWCIPISVNFSAVNNTPQIPVEKWYWDFGDGNTTTGEQVWHTYSTKGNYDVMFSATYGQGECSKDSSVRVSASAWPVADFKFAPPNAAMNNPEVKFTNLSQNALYIYWDFGNGDTSILVDPIYTFEKPGVYPVKLIVKNSFFCADSIIKDVYIADEPFIISPNAFTPNSDGNNDKLLLFFSGIESLDEFKIFNRWGEIVYESRDMRRGWDGTYNGIPQDEGTFTYYVIGKAVKTKKKVMHKGTFTLIR